MTEKNTVEVSNVFERVKNNDVVFDVLRLPGYFRLYFKDGYKAVFIEKAADACGSMKTLAERLGLSVTTLYYQLKHLERGLRIDDVLKMAWIIGVSHDDIRMNLTAWGYVGRYNAFEADDDKFKFITLDSLTAARLLGLYLGVTRRNKALKALQLPASAWHAKEMKRIFEDLGIGIHQLRKKRSYDDTLQFPRAVYYVLKDISRMGDGDEFITSPYVLPAWLMNADAEVKRGFLQSYLTKLSSINNYMLKKRSEARGTAVHRRYVELERRRVKEYSDSLRVFMMQVKDLLAEFGVESGVVLNHYTRNDGNCKMRFEIYSPVSLRKFEEEIGFLEPEKAGKLRKLIADKPVVARVKPMPRGERIFDVFRLPRHFLLYFRKEFKKAFLARVAEKKGNLLTAAEEMGVDKSLLYYHVHNRHGRSKGPVMGLQVRYVKRLIQMSGMGRETVRQGVEKWCYVGGHGVKPFTIMDIEPLVAAEMLGIYTALSLRTKQASRMELTTGKWHAERLREIFLSMGIDARVWKREGLGIKGKPRKATYDLPHAALAILQNISQMKGGFVDSPYLLPEWLMKADREVKRRFLWAHFNTVSRSVHYNSRCYIIYDRSRDTMLVSSLAEFMRQMVTLLGEFNIQTGKIGCHRGRRMDVERRDITSRDFSIYAAESLVAFDEEIGYVNPVKRAKFMSILEKSRSTWERKDDYVGRMIPRILREEGTLTSAELDLRISRHVDLGTSLPKLEKKGLVRRIIVGHQVNFNDFLWDIPLKSYVSEKQGMLSLSLAKQHLGSPAALAMRMILSEPLGRDGLIVLCDGRHEEVALGLSRLGLINFHDGKYYAVESGRPPAWDTGDMKESLKPVMAGDVKDLLNKASTADVVKPWPAVFTPPDGSALRAKAVAGPEYRNALAVKRGFADYNEYDRVTTWLRDARSLSMADAKDRAKLEKLLRKADEGVKTHADGARAYYERLLSIVQHKLGGTGASDSGAGEIDPVFRRCHR